MKRESDASAMQRLLIVCLVTCFLLSGAVALVYQTLWVRMFAIVFGNTSYAVSTVLSAFMGGLALGSWFFGRQIDKRPRLAIAAYGILEIGIALSAFALPYALRVTDGIHAMLYEQLLGSNLALSLVRFVLAFAVLIVPTTLMGGTLPVLVRFFVRRNDRVGDGVGTLYGANTMGAVIGCFVTGFYLIGMLGVSRTMMWTICVNLLIGIASLVLYSLMKSESQQEIEESAPDSFAGGRQCAADGGNVSRTMRAILCFSALGGMTALAYEVFWTRVLVFYMNNSIYAFTSMLTTLLLGLALGGYVFGKFVDGRRNLWLWFAGFEFVIGLWAILAFPVFDPLFHRLAETSKLFGANFWGVPVYVKMAKSAMLLLVPTLLMGATFPLLSKLYAKNIKTLGTHIGNIYSKNTIGSMVGAFVAGFIAIPLLGIQKGIIAVAAVNIGLALVAVWMSGVGLRWRQAIVVTMAVVATVCALGVPKEVFFRRHDEKWSNLLFYEEDNTATVKVYELDDEKRVISINGYEVAGSYVSLQEIQKALGHYPVLLHRNPQSALIVGFGAGGTSWTLSRYGLERIDLVEIVPAVLKAAPYLDEVNHGVLYEPNFRAVIDDGRNYVHATRKTYDIITVDSVDPKHAGNGNLYSVDFYEDCLSKLNPGGVMAEWIPYHLLSEKELKIIMKSFATAFPHHQLWFTPQYNYFILVGSPAEIVLDYARLSDVFLNPEIAADLRISGAISPASFVSTFAMDEDAIASYVSDIDQINTYDRPYIEFFGEYNYGTFGQLTVASPMGMPNIINMAAADMRAVEANALVALDIIKGRYYFTRKEYSKASDYWRKTLGLDPGNPVVRHMLVVLERTVKQEWDKRLDYLKRNPDDYLAYFETAAFCEEIRSPQSAIKMYEKAIEIKPDYEQAYNNLGLLYGRRGDYDHALEVLQTAMRINPVSPNAACNTGTVYYLKGEFQKAEDIYSKALGYPSVARDVQLRMKIQRVLRSLSQARGPSGIRSS